MARREGIASGAWQRRSIEADVHSPESLFCLANWRFSLKFWSRADALSFGGSARPVERFISHEQGHRVVRRSHNNPVWRITQFDNLNYAVG
jgi:hypothetical protein